jgi:hypothetical protein
MGFLDFLKKEKQQPIEMPPAPSSMAEIPPPMPMHEFTPPIAELEPPQAPEPQAPTPPVPEQFELPKQESLDLPDFTEEEVEAADEAPVAVKQPIMAPEPLVAPDYIELRKAPVQAMALPELPELPSLPQVSAPMRIAPENVETKYLSSESYLMVTGHGKAIRRAIRQNDEAIKNAMLVHEQLDAQYRRIATDTNSVQELLMKIEGSLFEE